MYQNHLSDQQSIYDQRIEYLNHVTTEVSKSIVRIFKSSIGDVTTTSASGIIFYADEEYYYVITNYHVAFSNDFQTATYYVFDFQNTRYIATFVAGDNTYDLAVLKFKIRNEILPVITFAMHDAVISDHLTTIGYPESQFNTINSGIVVGYNRVTIENMPTSLIDLNFDVMVASIPVKSGSSGSGAINDSYELAGVVFAGNFSNGNSTADFAFMIPISRVKVFLIDHQLFYILPQS